MKRTGHTTTRTTTSSTNETSNRASSLEDPVSTSNALNEVSIHRTTIQWVLTQIYKLNQKLSEKDRELQRLQKQLTVLKQTQMELKSSELALRETKNELRRLRSEHQNELEDMEKKISVSRMMNLSKKVLTINKVLESRIQESNLQGTLVELEEVKRKLHDAEEQIRAEQQRTSRAKEDTEGALNHNANLEADLEILTDRNARLSSSNLTLQMERQVSEAWKEK